MCLGIRKSRWRGIHELSPVTVVRKLQEQIHKAATEVVTSRNDAFVVEVRRSNVVTSTPDEASCSLKPVVILTFYIFRK